MMMIQHLLNQVYKGKQEDLFVKQFHRGHKVLLMSFQKMVGCLSIIVTSFRHSIISLPTLYHLCARIPSCFLGSGRDHSSPCLSHLLPAMATRQGDTCMLLKALKMDQQFHIYVFRFAVFPTYVLSDPCSPANLCFPILAYWYVLLLHNTAHQKQTQQQS